MPSGNSSRAAASTSQWRSRVEALLVIQFWAISLLRSNPGKSSRSVVLPRDTITSATLQPLSRSHDLSLLQTFDEFAECGCWEIPRCGPLPLDQPREAPQGGDGFQSRFMGKTRLEKAQTGGP